jgi:hyperosmotically inducible periplasmic protein
MALGTRQTAAPAWTHPGMFPTNSNTQRNRKERSVTLGNRLTCIYAMTYSKAALVLLICTVFFIGCGQNSDMTAQAPDNTRVNERDRNPAEQTADQQNENERDRDLTQKIRQLVMADETYSTNAQNIKIISHNGMVTLKGPVNTAEEKRSIVAKAVSATGDANKVTDQISVEN